MSEKKYVIGVDFGTLSGRAVLVEAATGSILGQRECRYPHGVMTSLPGGPDLGSGWAIQDPADYLAVLEGTIPPLLRESGVAGKEVAAIGCDVTSCTILPALGDGTPLCKTAPYVARPHAYVKMWKHHGALHQARRIEAWAKREYPALLARYGGKVSSQWMLPKILQLLEEDPEVYRDCDLILEAVDWLALTLTGTLRRNTCCAGFKSFWSEDAGYPPQEFFTGLDARLKDLVPAKLRGGMAAPWQAVGHLTPDWAKRLGLTTDAVVASGIIDAHAGVLGSGITEPGRLMMILGTSACHILLCAQEVEVPGICGSSKDAILPGLCAYEAGQACVGDMLDWFVRNNVPAAITSAAERQGVTVHQLLTQQADALRPGESGLLALDWWNGQRTPLVDDRLTGMMLGQTLRTTPAQQYRALMEAAAFGAKLVVETLEAAGIRAEEIVACGGIVGKNPVMMQIYADVLERPIRVAASDQCPALGAAVLAATAAGIYETAQAAVQHMTGPGSTVYTPQKEHQPPYRTLYSAYRALTDLFGGGSVMKDVLALRESAAGK